MQESGAPILRIKEIDQEHSTSSFSLGKAEHAPLKTFLRRYAKNSHKTNVVKTYVLIEEKAKRQTIRGYISLICSQIKLNVPQRPVDCEIASKYKDYPAVKIARLAIDHRYQNRGLGGDLIDFGIAMVIDYIMPNVGCRFLVVDAKQSATSYYENHGFTLLDTAKNKKAKHPVLFLDLHKLWLSFRT